jgi:hypothetical protein
MRYRVDLPEPTAKRLAHSRQLMVIIEGCWTGCHATKYELGDASSFEFEVPDDVPLFGSIPVLDMTMFRAEVKYSNSTGSRTETHRLQPVAIS